MPFFRAALALLLGLAAPVTAQQVDGEVVVTASTEAKSAWRRAESAHFVVLSRGADGELTRVTQRLEQLHALMARLYLAGQPTDDAAKLQVVLVDTVQQVPPPDAAGPRGQEGPYTAGFGVRRHYDARVDGELLVVARVDQTIALNTARRFGQNCDDLYADGGEGPCGKSVKPVPPLTRPWEANLYAAFARRFVRAYLPAPYPAWYLDGIGALFSTITVNRDGALAYAGPPAGHQSIFRSYGDLRAQDILSGRYLDAPDAASPWTPYHAWQVAHFFLFADEGKPWATPFAAYMAAIREGKVPGQAVAAFDDMDRLRRDFGRYARRAPRFAQTAPSTPTPGDAALVTTLSKSAGALLDLRIALGDEADADQIARVRAAAARYPDDPDFRLFLAGSECRLGHADECRAAADAVLARRPDDAAALAWQGMAMTAQALTRAPTERAAGLAAARATIERALARDERAPVAALAYFRSFADAGEPVSDRAMTALAQVVRTAPAAPAPRVLLARELMRQGQPGLARRLVAPVLYDPEAPPERAEAQRLFAPAGDGPIPSPPAPSPPPLSPSAPTR